jgi:Family of unknown function (DUF6011)
MTMTTDAYLNAPATELLATSCCLCGRALLDAASIERGIGPTCAQKAGVGEAAHPADWSRVSEVLASVKLTVSCDDARREANRLVHRIGHDPHAKEVPTLVEAIEALGYLKLAATLAEHLAPVTVRVEAEGSTFSVSADLPRGEVFDAFVAAMRAVPGRRWDSDRKRNVVPARSKRDLWAALLDSLPVGAVVVGSRVTVIREVVSAAN